ncbi:MAG: helix-turn-helix domain-containing protein [Acidimicrobiia bacterium]|nr:helix-turn-helix domain-containing protein [Acidimicrobiia bacterium]
MDVQDRARRHAALGDPIRLALVDDLAASDRSPTELGRRHELPSNLLAHHLDVLEEAGLVERTDSTGDRRRRYVRLRRAAVLDLGMGVTSPEGPVLFVCTHNSARSQLAAALWRREVGSEADSAGTHPADRVHPGAIAAARRAGLDLSDARPKTIDEAGLRNRRVITVCDRAHEELEPDGDRLHWSTPDPADDPAPDAFDAALGRLRARIVTMQG